MSLPFTESFLSRSLRNRLSKRLPLAGPEMSQLEGAVLLTDIQGFTAMLESFSERGSEGLEELTWALNGYFADVAETVDRFGGDVIAIAGDSFLCLWNAMGDLTLEEATARASQAGLAIQAALHDREAAPGMRFPTRIGVGCGSVTLTFIGGHQDAWHCLLGGEAHQAAVRAESLADPGQVLLSPHACQAVEPFATLVTEGDGHGRLQGINRAPPPLQAPTESVAPERLKPCVLPTVLVRQDLPSQEWIAELRVVTLFLICLPPIDAQDKDSEETLNKVHALIRGFQQVVGEFDGTARVDIDAKGNLLLGLWGLPPHVHEDDAIRAVEAARALRERIPGGQDLSIGVATGRALCGVFGSESRRDYIVRGQVITLAAGLMQAACGRVLIDRQTITSARQRMVYDDLPPIAIKGHALPVPVAIPHGRRQESMRDGNAMIGRDAELRQLQNALTCFLDNPKLSIWRIEGEAGLGKSLLVQTIAREARRREATVLAASAEAMDQRSALAAWRGVFTEILGGGDAASLQHQLEQRLALLPELAPLAPLITEVLPLQLQESPLTREMTGEVRGESTRRLLGGILSQVARDGATILLFEDAHWADTASRSLLKRLVEEEAPLMILSTTRPPLNGQRSILSDMDECQVIELASLHDDEIEQIVGAEIGINTVPTQLLTWVKKRVAGHPFFARELVRALRETQAVSIRDGRIAVGNLESLSLPMTVEGIISSRLNQLTAPQQLTLKVAAVVGRVFSEQTVRDTHPLPEADVAKHLETFTHHSIITPHDANTRDTYAFRHVLLRDVTYDQMPRNQRRTLHRAVAAWLERQHADQLAPIASLLAFHWQRAEVPESSLRWLEAAAEHALRSGTFAEAIANYQQAMSTSLVAPALASPRRKAHWTMGLGMAAYFLGDFQTSRLRLEEAVHELDRAVPISRRETLFALLREAIQQAGNRLINRQRIASGTSQLKDSIATSECYRSLSQIYFLQGEPAERLAYLTLRGLNVGERTGSSATLARTLANMGALMSFLGLKAWGAWYGMRAVSMAEKEGQFAASAYVHHIGSLRLITDGMVGEALASNTQALERIVALGDFNLELEAMSVRAMIAATNGLLDIAEPAARRCVALARQHGSLAMGGWAQLNLVDVDLARGDVPSAQAALAKGRALLTGLQDVASLALHSRAEACLAHHQGRWDDALRSARSTIQTIGTAMPTAYYLAEAYLVAAEILAAGARAGQAVSHPELRRVARRLDRMSGNFRNVRERAQSLSHGLRRWPPHGTV